MSSDSHGRPLKLQKHIGSSPKNATTLSTYLNLVKQSPHPTNNPPLTNLMQHSALANPCLSLGCAPAGLSSDSIGLKCCRSITLTVPSSANPTNPSFIHILMIGVSEWCKVVSRLPSQVLRVRVSRPGREPRRRTVLFNCVTRVVCVLVVRCKR